GGIGLGEPVAQVFGERAARRAPGVLQEAIVHFSVLLPATATGDPPRCGAGWSPRCSRPAPTGGRWRGSSARRPTWARPGRARARAAPPGDRPAARTSRAAAPPRRAPARRPPPARPPRRAVRAGGS